MSKIIVDKDKMCARCGRHRMEHEAETMACPCEKRARIGFTRYHEQYRFCRPQAVSAVSNWGRRLLWQGKIGTGPSALVIVKQHKQFYVGKHIYYCDINDVQGMCVGCTPPWRTGVIWKIEAERLFIERM